MLTRIALVIMLMVLNYSQAQVYIEPAEGTRCPKNATYCYDINSFGGQMQGQEYYGSNNLTVLFLEGTHILKLDRLITLVNMNNAVFSGIGRMVWSSDMSAWQSTVLIRCANSSGFNFISGTNITFKSMTIIGCGDNEMSTSLLFFRVKNITIDGVSIQNGSGDSLLVDSESSNVLISSSSFVKHASSMERNVFIHIIDPEHCPELMNTSIVIINTNITHGKIGLLVSFMYNEIFAVNLLLDGVIVINHHQGESYIYIPKYYNITFNNVFTNSGLFIQTNTLQFKTNCPILPVIRSYINIINSKFTIKGVVFELLLYHPATIIISSTEISQTSNAALRFYRTHYNDTWTVKLDNVTVHNGRRSAIIAYYVTILTLINVTITNHTNTGLVALGTNVVIARNSESIIANNKGSNGGGLALHQSSTITLGSNSVLNFINNTATKQGGAIFIEGFRKLFAECFFQFEQFVVSQAAKVLFSGNKADKSGSVIHGATIYCTLTIWPFIPAQNMIDLFEKTFNYSQQTGLSLLSMDPTNVYYCKNGKPDRSKTKHEVSASPGSVVTISVAIVGADTGFEMYSGILTYAGIVPGVLQQKEIADNKGTNLFNTKPQECSNVSFIVKSCQTKATHVLYHFTVSEIDLPPLKLNVTFQDCPIGFAVSNSSGICDCDQFLRQRVPNITCDIQTKSISQSANKWIASAINNSDVVIGDCSLDYCIMGEVNFTLTNPDPICAFNRTSRMCGRCQDGFSLVFGSNQCLQCPYSSFIGLIVPFAAAGFVLVALLMVLNLTVSTGTINGLLFYANIVKTSESILFPRTQIPVLNQFVSWLNLDLDIQTCFYNGMTAYGKVGLQFVFPVYIWLIIAMITILCRYSSWLSRKIGRNIMQVLATLILLSYTKLIRTVFLAVNRSILFHESGGYKNVWYIDGSVDYLGTWQHILLFCMSIIYLILAIPYTVTLLTSILIEKYLTRVGAFSTWWLKFKPLIDAYNGPYKDNCRFWTGLLLLVRLSLVAMVTSGMSKDIIEVSIITVSVALLLVMVYFNGVYQKKYLDILESWSLLNLVLITSLAQHHQQIGFIISVSVMMVCATGILIYHIITVIHSNCVRRKLTKNSYVSIEDSIKQDQSYGSTCSTTSKNVTHSELFLEREPLLFPGIIN